MKPYYERAGITIYHGDCREILPGVPSVDMVLTDPPYSSGGAFNVTLPASFSDQDWIDFVDVGMALSTNNVTILRNGNNIRRVAEDLILDVSSDSLRLVARTSLGWIEQ